MTTVILRINQVQSDGLRGTAEVPGGESRTFSSDEDLVDAVYELTEPESPGNGPGSTSSSPIRAT